MDCAFCASGLQGQERNLTAGEILAQVYYFQRLLSIQDARVSRVVVMGSGEPMLNLDNVLKALDILHEDHEPDCAVKAALTTGEVAQSRYNSYVSMLTEIKNKKEGNVKK